jgi:RHS repeat-associated protein
VVTYQDGTTAVVSNTANPLWPFPFDVMGRYPWCPFTTDPVNISTGNATYEFTDLALPGKGSSLTFTRTYNSQDVANSGFLGRGWRCEYQTALEFPTAAEVTLIAADGRQEIFTASGGGDYTSPQGVTERLHKNANGSFTITHLDQSHLEFDSGGRLSSAVDRYGNATTLTYNTSGQLTGVTEAGGRTLSFTYDYAYLTQVEDNAGRTASFTYDTGGNLVSATDPNGHTTTYTYDSNHQLTSVSEPEPSANPLMTNTYTDGRVTLQTDALGNETALSFDTTNQETTVTDARGNVTVEAWDAHYRLIEQTDPYDNSGSILYNTAGFPESVTDANGHTSSFVYDSLGNIISATDPEGHETEASYDSANGNQLWFEDAADQRTTYSWDASGTFLDSIETPVGTTSFTWNTNGTLDSLTDAESHTWEYGYNAYGDLTSIVDPLSFVTTCEYDSAGRTTAVEDANSSRVEYVYDAKGNVTSIKDPLAETDPLNRHQIDFTYDDNDNATSVIDARGNETWFTYDDMNRLTSTEDALSGQASFGYDSNHNLTSVEDPSGHTATYVYDDCDRLASIADPLGRLTEYAYDQAGNLIGVTHADDSEATYTYTADDLLLGVSYSSEPTTWSFAYNPVHALSGAQNQSGQDWTYAYDSGNRVISQADENNTSLGPLAIDYTYDDASNVTDIDIGNLVSLALTYDARDLIATLTDDGGVSTFTHDSGGRLTQIATPEGSSRSFSYDAASNLTSVANTTGPGAQTFSYTYDASGNRLTSNDETYTYDARNRLVSWYDPVDEVTTTYVYDAAGNLTGVQEDSVPTESYTYNAANEITNTGFTYDANGNLTSDGIHTYAYDTECRLVEVEEGGVAVSMTYDFLGRRTSLTRNSATSSDTTYFHYDGALLVAESDESGIVTATYAYDDQGLLISMTRGAATYYYQTNAHGDVVSLTDETGTIVNAYSYDPWGRVLEADETVGNPFRYAGYYYDPGTDLYYLWNRYYDPGLRRFLTEDPLGGCIDETQSLNVYAYVQDNPLRYADPQGLAYEDYIGPYPNPHEYLQPLPKQNGGETPVLRDLSQGSDHRWQQHDGMETEWPHYQEQKRNENGSWKDTGRHIPEKYWKESAPNRNPKVREGRVSKDNPWGRDPNAQQVIEMDDLPMIIPVPAPPVGEAVPVLRWIVGVVFG